MSHPNRRNAVQQIVPHALGHVLGERQSRCIVHIVAQIAGAKPEIVAVHERGGHMRTRVQNCIWEWETNKNRLELVLAESLAHNARPNNGPRTLQRPHIPFANAIENHLHIATAVDIIGADVLLNLTEHSLQKGIVCWVGAMMSVHCRVG